MKKILFCCAVLFFAHQMAFAQRDTIRVATLEDLPIVHEWLGPNSRTFTHFMGLTYLTPEGFTEKPFNRESSFRGNLLLANTFVFIGTFGQLQSDDGEMVAFFNVVDHRPFLPRFNPDVPEESHIDNRHVSRIRTLYNEFHIFKAYTQGLIEPPTFLRRRPFQLDWRESANFFSSEEARSKFNADSAFFLTLRLPPGYYHQDKFGYMDVFGLQKNGRGFIYIYSFYTETAMQNIECYRRRLWGSVHFAEEPPPTSLMKKQKDGWLKKPKDGWLKKLFQ